MGLFQCGALNPYSVSCSYSDVLSENESNAKPVASMALSIVE
jgi:hypothetical protein